MRQALVLVCLVFATASLAGCTYDRGEGPPGIHFAEFRVAPPEGNSVEVCHAYTCQMNSMPSISGCVPASGPASKVVSSLQGQADPALNEGAIEVVPLASGKQRT